MWSEELQQQTKEFLEKYPVAAMKHFGDMKFGICMIK
jgi:Tfp pilus assembly protein PilP